MDGDGRVRLKAHYSGVLFITNVDPATTFQELCAEVRDMCGLSDGHPLTLKWVDSEGDPCTVSSQMELEEAFRLAYQRRAVLILHVFPSVPAQPGLPCPGEDRPWPTCTQPSAWRYRTGFLASGGTLRHRLRPAPRDFGEAKQAGVKNRGGKTWPTPGVGVASPRDQSKQPNKLQVSTR